MWVVGGAFPGVAGAAVGHRRGWPTVFLRAVSADQCGFSCAVISRRLPKLVESLIAPKLLLTALFSFLPRQSYPRYIFSFFSVSTRDPSAVPSFRPFPLGPRFFQTSLGIFNSPFSIDHRNSGRRSYDLVCFLFLCFL